MIIRIDVDKLQEDGVLTPELADQLRASSLNRTASHALGALMVFGAIAITIGLCVYSRSVYVANGLGVMFYLIGAYIQRMLGPAFAKLGSVAMIIGALMMAATAPSFVDKPLVGMVLATLILAGTGIYARSRMLIALTPITLAAAIGGSTGYWDGCYEIAIREPTLTILLFTPLALAAIAVSRKLPAAMAALALMFAYMSLILVNFGFWVGSLWGDEPGGLWSDTHHGLFAIPAYAFVIAWIAILVLAGIWGARSGRLFLVNVAIIFFGIEFYTKFFEHTGPNPLAIVLAGAATVAIGLILWGYNRKRLEA